MAGSFSVTVSVVDQATRKFREINKAFDLISKPVGHLKSLTNDLGKAFGALESPIAAITGGSVILGIAAFATQWGRAGENVLNTSARIGVTTDNLQLLQGAAKLTGVSAESLSGGLRSLGDTLQDALYGRNQQALVILGRLGIHINRTATGAVDANQAFLDLADAIARVPNPQVQAVIARAFGLEEMLPILRKGSAGIKELEEAVHKSGAVMSPGATKAAAEFAETLTSLGQAIAGVGNAIGEKLIPVLDPAIKKMTEFTQTHGAGVASAAGGVASGLAWWLGAGASGVKGVLDMGGGLATGDMARARQGAGEYGRGFYDFFLGPFEELGKRAFGAIAPVPSAAAVTQNGKVTVEIRTSPGTTARPTWEGSLIDDVKVENSMPVGPP